MSDIKPVPAIAIRNMGKQNGPRYNADDDFALVLQRIQQAGDKALGIARSYPRLRQAVTYRAPVYVRS